MRNKPRSRPPGKNHRRINRRRNPRKRVSSAHNFTVHRRLVVYPKDESSSWLDKLSWFSSVALKLFTTIAAVGDDLFATTVTTSSGVTILLGPQDFAAVCPAASKVYTSGDVNIQALRVLPYERSSLGNVKVRITPAIDSAYRAGMYAAVLIPCDEMAQAIGHAPDYPHKYVPEYDEIIKHPKAVMSPATKTLTLHLSVNNSPHTILPYWEEKTGYHNQYSTHVLMLAFSSLAATSVNAAAEYSVYRAQFEVHLTGNLRLFDPGSIPAARDKPEGSESYCTSKLSLTDPNSKSVRFHHLRYDIPCGEKFDLRSIPLDESTLILTHYNRLDLLQQLREFKELEAITEKVVLLE